MKDIAESVCKAVEPIINQLGYELVDVEYKSEYNQMNLTIFVFSPEEGGTSLQTCEQVHRAIDPVLDELDPTDGAPYNLNVSSPGLDRPFKKARDFERNLEKQVEAKLIHAVDKKNRIEGILKGYQALDTGYRVRIEVNNTEVELESSNLRFVRPLVKF